MTPRATVRLQFHAGFTLDDAAVVVPYYAALGISHVYASPLLASRRGSTHGYDGVRPDQIDAELGGEPGLRRLVAALRAHGMGLVLDLVPNHMSASLENPWWLDVLEHGRNSTFAGYFDIDWDAGGDRVLLPWLTGPLDALIDSGDVAIHLDATTERLYVHAGPARAPLAAASYAEVLGSDAAAAGAHPADAGEALALHVAALAAARSANAFDDARRALFAALERSPALRTVVQAALERFLPVDEERRARVRALLARQPWRLADWHAAPKRINWRRFFDIGALAALRIECAEVFDAVHAYPLALFAEGLIDGLRIDHVDGLLDPPGYCRRLRAELERCGTLRPAGLSREAWLVVEKILSGDERLRENWAIDGSTGYDFMEQVGALLHAPDGEATLTRTWQSLHADAADGFPEVALRARREILRRGFAADLQRALRAIALLLGVPADSETLRAAITALIEQFPVYRTYIGAARCAPEDRDVLDRAAAAACAQLDADGRRLLDALLVALCAGDAAGGAGGGERRANALAALQQLTPPIAAKAIEDTAFYRYARLLSRNEVGAEPQRFSASVQRFQEQCSERARRWPRALLATATHDHKRGEDARARLSVLGSEASWWSGQQRAWSAQNAAHREMVDELEAPDPIDEYMLYQTLLGAWPPELRADDHAALASLGERIAGWQRKALREAKRRSSWNAPAERYEAACARFLQRLLQDRAFLDSASAAVERLAVAGARKSLAQTLLRLTVPGVPDLYQGTEFWDHSLVDPDNRRPVDHRLRADALADGAPATELLAQWRDGRIKQRLIARMLLARRDHLRLFAEGSHVALRLQPATTAHTVAFLRQHGDHLLLVIAPVQLHGDAGGSSRLGFSETVLDGAAIALPPHCRNRRWTNLLDATAVELHGDMLPLASVLHEWPVAALHSAG